MADQITVRISCGAYEEELTFTPEDVTDMRKDLGGCNRLDEGAAVEWASRVIDRRHAQLRAGVVTVGLQ